MKKVISENPAIRKLYDKIKKTADQLDNMLIKINQMIAKEKAAKGSEAKTVKKAGKKSGKSIKSTAGKSAKKMKRQRKTK